MPAGQHPRFSVVLIDDNMHDIELLRDAMGQQAMPIDLNGFTRTGDAFAFLASGAHVDLLISDLNMPEMDGVELLARVAADPALAGISTLLMSTLERCQLPPAYRDAGGVPFLTKAATWPQFLALAREIEGCLIRSRDDRTRPDAGTCISDEGRRQRHASGDG